MMKLIFLIFFLLTISSLSAQAQITGDTLFMDRGLPPHAYYQGEENISFRKMKKIMRSNEQAYTLVKKARNKRNTAKALFVIGLAFAATSADLISSPGDAVAVIGISGIFIGASIPLSIKANKQTRMAIDLYNKGFRSTSFKPTLKLGLLYNGISLNLSF